MANTKINLNIDELKTLLNHTIDNNKYLQSLGKIPLAINVEGIPGIGKTSVIEQLAVERNSQFVKLCLSELEEISDLVGFPLRQFQLCKADDCKWIDEPAVEEYIKQGYNFTGEKRMSYCAPEWIVDKGEDGILLIDDYTRADQRFIQATMNLIDRQSYISWKLPKGWSIFLSTNPDEGLYQVSSLDTAQLTRFSTVNLKFDIDCWARYAEKSGVDERAINFLLMTPEIVTEKCNARAITNFFNSISSFDKFENHLPMIQMLGEGSVGSEFSTLFTTFINNKLDRIISPKEVLTNKNWSYIKGELNSCIGMGDSYRADIASILTTRLINYGAVYSEKNSITQDIIDRIVMLCTEEDIFANDLKYMIIKGLLNANKAKFQKILLNPNVVRMAVK